jgi:hypothetical protein
MKTLFVRSAAVLLVASAAACGGSDEAGSDHLRGLKEGMTTAQALETMGTGPLASTYSDTMRIVNGFRRSRYFMNGTIFEVVYARDIPGDVKEPVLQAKETPVVFRNDTLLGWGWKYYAETAIPKFALPTPLRAIDTLTAPAPTAPSADTGMAGQNKLLAAPDTTKKD